MNVLGIETATAICATAVVAGEDLLAECSLEAPQVHSERLLPLIDECLRKAKLELSRIDGIATSIGPGSFTGLRIGLSVAKGLAFASGKPLVAVPTLEALAYEVCRRGEVQSGTCILPLLDARRDEVYCALYRWEGNSLSECRQAAALRLQDIGSILPRDANVIAAGNGLEKFMSYLSSSGNSGSRIGAAVRPVHCRCSAAAVAVLGSARLHRGEVAEIESLEPMYVKDFCTVAKPQRTQVIL